MTPESPLKGIKVADFSQGVAGPHCTMLLGQHGAQVIKFEPLEGDWGRIIGPLHGDFCAYALAFNRGKRSLALDLKVEVAAGLAREIAAEADIVIESFRPGVMKKFGLDYDRIKTLNAGVVYISITGFGQEGPYRDHPATDLVIQAYSGLMSSNRDSDGTPLRLGMIPFDVMTGVYACQAVMAALLRKFRFGQGDYIDCSLTQCAAAFQSAQFIEQAVDGGPPPLHFTPVGVMKTRDGHIGVAIRSDAQYKAFCHDIGREDLCTDPRFDRMAKRNQNTGELMPLIRAEFLRRTSAEWADVLTRAGAHNAPVMSYQDFMDDEHVKATNCFAWVEQDGVGRMPLANVPGTPVIGGRGFLDQSPHIGQHTVEILQERGMARAHIDELIARKVFGTGRQ